MAHGARAVLQLAPIEPDSAHESEWDRKPAASIAHHNDAQNTQCLNMVMYRNAAPEKRGIDASRVSCDPIGAS